MGSAQALRDLIEPPLAAAGLELWDVEVVAGIVRVLVDRPGGVDLDVLSEASSALSPLLDARPDLAPADAYQLEVSSPGIERSLRTPDQYRRYIGETVSVKTTSPVAGSRRIHGTLAAVRDDAIEVSLDGAPAGAEPLTVPLAVISRTRTVLVWGPTPKPGRPARSSTSPSSAKDATS